MRWTAWWAVPLVSAALAVACGNSNDGETGHPSPTVNDSGDQQPVAEDGGVDAGVDAGTDAGQPSEDGGTDAGTDAGPVTINFPTAAGWEFYGPQHGGPREVYGVSSDDSGNIWVAGGSEGLFLLPPGASEYIRFGAADGLTANCDVAGTVTCDVISVTGGPANTVFVGYRGAGTDSESDPMWQQKSGDADKVVWNGAGLTATHYDIASPPGLYSQYPNGREKVRSVLRILWDAKTGNVWFGSNHGVAMYEARSKMVWEHQHRGINGYKLSAAEDPSGNSKTNDMYGDYWGISLDPAGDLWMAGAHRMAKLQYASSSGFWGTIDPVIDVWPDPVVGGYPRPEERVDDNVSELVSDGDGVWVASSFNGLARVSPSGTWFVDKSSLADPGGVTALEKDPADGSLWVGHMWGGLTRIKGSTYQHYSWNTFGRPLIDYVVRDIQSDTFQGHRRIFVAFSGGAIGVYTGE